MMADYQDDEEGPKGPQPGTDPNVAAFANAFENAPEGTKDWAADASNILNNYAQTREIAEANRAAGDAMVNNLHNFKSGLVGMVTEDPAAVHTALDLVPLTVRGVINETPHGREEGADETHAALTKDIQGDVAHAAVVAAAERNADAARGLLSHDRIGTLIDEDQRGPLNAYIVAQEVARGADEAGQRQEIARQQEQVTNAATHEHLSGLYNAATGGVTFVPGWAQRLTADPDVSGTDKGALMHMYGRLQNDGDGASHPQVVSNILQDIAQARQSGGALPLRTEDILVNVGSSDPNDRLSLKDAMWLNGLLHTDTAEGRENIQNLADTAAKAQRQIMGLDGSNGAAGFQAYQRFMDWFVPAYQKTGPAGLNPAAENFLFQGTNIKAFLPTGEDLVIGGRAQSSGFSSPPVGWNEQASRRPLDEIFGKPTGKRAPPVEMPQIRNTPDPQAPGYVANPEIKT